MKGKTPVTLAPAHEEPIVTGTLVSVEETGDQWTVTVTATYGDGSSEVIGKMIAGAHEIVPLLAGVAQSALDQVRTSRPRYRTRVGEGKYLTVHSSDGSLECFFATPAQLSETIQADHSDGTPLGVISVAKVMPERVSLFTLDPQTNAFRKTRDVFTLKTIPVEIIKDFDDANLMGIRATVRDRFEFETKRAGGTKDGPFELVGVRSDTKNS